MRIYSVVRKKALVAACLALFGFVFGLSQPVMAWTGDGYVGPVTVCTLPEATIIRMSNNDGKVIRAVSAICKSFMLPCWISTVEWLVLRSHFSHQSRK